MFGCGPTTSKILKKQGESGWAVRVGSGGRFQWVGGRRRRRKFRTLFVQPDPFSSFSQRDLPKLVSAKWYSDRPTAFHRCFPIKVHASRTLQITRKFLDFARLPNAVSYHLITTCLNMPYDELKCCQWINNVKFARAHMNYYCRIISCSCPTFNNLLHWLQAILFANSINSNCLRILP